MINCQMNDTDNNHVRVQTERGGEGAARAGFRNEFQAQFLEQLRYRWQK